MYQDLKCINVFNEILIMTIGELIFNLPSDLKTLIEKQNRKNINTQLSLVFNKTCIKRKYAATEYKYIYI